MDFRGHVYGLRSKGLALSEWRGAHLRWYLEKPQEPFRRTTITTVRLNQNFKMDSSDPGDYIKRGHLR